MTATLIAQPHQLVARTAVVSRPAVESHRPAPRLAPEVYRARRLAVLALAVGLAAGALIGLSSGLSPASAGRGGGTGLEDSLIVTVMPGDTLWQIARSLSPGADPRPLVHDLAIIAGDGPIQPGQSLAIPRSILD